MTSYKIFCKQKFLWGSRKFTEVNFLTDQTNEEADNKQQIQRCKEFREMVYKDIINLLHDKKDIVMNTHKNNMLI